MGTPFPPFSLGLHEVADACHAYLQPDGRWGYSNAGLVVGDGASLLVDTLFDLRLTSAMLDAMAAVTAGAPIGTLVNTHANGDHCYGNELVSDAHIVASEAAAEEMAEVPPSMLAAMAELDGELGATFRRFFGDFEFSGIELPPVDETFRGELTLSVGGRSVELRELGPAHTRGDVIAWVPDERVVYTGDLCFIGGTPLTWAGPIANWVAACDHIIGLDPVAVVPGHGPVTDTDGVRAVRDYLAHVDREARTRHEAGMSVTDAANDIELGEYADWLDAGRIIANVDAVYRALDADHEPLAVTDLFVEMAAYESRKQ